MYQTFKFENGNEIQISHSEEIAFHKECDTLSALGMLFHYVQQQGGRIALNYVPVYALSMAQTCGMAASPGDYVGLDRPTTKVATLQSLLK